MWNGCWIFFLVMIANVQPFLFVLMLFISIVYDKWRRFRIFSTARSKSLRILPNPTKMKASPRIAEKESSTKDNKRIFALACNPSTWKFSSSGNKPLSKLEYRYDKDQISIEYHSFLECCWVVPVCTHSTHKTLHSSQHPEAVNKRDPMGSMHLDLLGAVPLKQS